MNKQSSVAGSLWTQPDLGWTYLPYAQWASQYGLAFSVWVAPDPVGTYLQNLAAAYSVIGDEPTTYDRSILQRVQLLLKKEPSSIESLVSQVPGFSERWALWLLAHKVAYGPWKSVPIQLSDRFLLYADPEQAQQIDEALLQANHGATSQSVITDPLLCASTTDLAKARERLARLELIDAGELPATRRMQQLARQVRKAVADGQLPLSSCLTRYVKSGNRNSRLLPEQEQAIETVISRYWNTGKARRPKDLLYIFENECEQLGVEPAGRKRLDRCRKSESPLRHALSTGGFRAYHAVRSSTDPRVRSTGPLGYGQILHIDSSDLDVRCAPDLLTQFPAAKAKFYLGLDGATGDTMAHALIFGPARTDGLALLLREYVKRHRMLPKMIHVDRGPENTSHWLREFCEGRISIRHSPTAASAWNGIAENAIKQVNDQVAHTLIGSTAPDQKGRKVDGRFKSSRNARTAFITVLERFIRFAYEDLPNTPRADGQSPLQKREEAISKFGVMGTPCAWNDDFLIQTSIHVRKRGKTNQYLGIRTNDGYFVSDELLTALRTHQPDQVRSDCVDPTILYVQIDGQWIKAFHSRVQSVATLTESERLFELLWAPISRTEAEKTKNDISRTRQKQNRLQLAEVAKPAVQHLASVPTDEEEVIVQPPRYDFPVSELDLLPFDEREDY